MVTLADLPIELFIDHIFPILPVSDLLSLACTNRFFSQLASDEPFWHRKIQEDFNFPTSDTARNAGWKFLYRRLFNPKVLVWGYVCVPHALSSISLPSRLESEVMVD